MKAKNESCDQIVNILGLANDQWLTYRRSGIGGSDAATIVGLNPFSSKFYLYNDKLGLLPPKETSEAMRIGHDLEQYVANRWMERTGKKCRNNNIMWRSKMWPWMIADIDREVVGENAGLECKTTSPYGKFDFEGGEIPPYYYCQCQHYMAVLGFDRMYLAVLVLGRGFYDFVIERSDSEIYALADAEKQFWDLVESKTPPDIDGSEATSEALRAMYPKENQDGGLALLPSACAPSLAQMEDMQQSIKELKEQCDGIKSIIMREMGDAPLATVGGYKCSWVTQTRSSIDTKRLKAEQPEIYRQYLKSTESRVFRLSNMKEKQL